MSTLETAPPASWIAAYAMGLASAEGEPDAVVEQVAEAAAHDETQLRAARRELFRLEIFDDELREAASHLLTRAVDLARSGGRARSDRTR